MNIKTVEPIGPKLFVGLHNSRDSLWMVTVEQICFTPPPKKKKEKKSTKDQQLKIKIDYGCKEPWNIRIYTSVCKI